jgi:hypothetical protein
LSYLRIAGELGTSDVTVLRWRHGSTPNAELFSRLVQLTEKYRYVYKPRLPSFLKHPPIEPNWSVKKFVYRYPVLANNNKEFRLAVCVCPKLLERWLDGLVTGSFDREYTQNAINYIEKIAAEDAKRDSDTLDLLDKFMRERYPDDNPEINQSSDQAEPSPF